MAPVLLAENGAASAAAARCVVHQRLDASEDRSLLAGGFAALDDRERRVPTSATSTAGSARPGS